MTYSMGYEGVGVIARGEGSKYASSTVVSLSKNISLCSYLSAPFVLHSVPF